MHEAVAAALVNELGLTNPRFSDRDSSAPPEIGCADLTALTAYVRTLPLPTASRTDASGRAVFLSAGCASCHVPRVTDDDEVRGPAVEPFTDLLLHDMGPGLADGFDDFERLRYGASARPARRTSTTAVPGRSTARFDFMAARQKRRSGAMNA